MQIKRQIKGLLAAAAALACWWLRTTRYYFSLGYISLKNW